jgi:STE24 endopeptidase
LFGRRRAHSVAFSAEDHAAALRYQRSLRFAARLAGFGVAGLTLLLPWLADQFDLPWRYFFGPWVFPLIGIVVVVQLILALPMVCFRLWLSLRHDRRWGLSTIGAGRLLRVLAIEMGIGLAHLVVLAIVSWVVFRRRDDWWILEEWGVLAGYAFLTYAVWPLRSIASLGTKPAPAHLEREVDDLARRFETRRPKLVVIDASAMRSAPNAFVSGIGPTTTISVMDSLLALSDADRRAVLAHEFGHVKNRDAEKRAAFVAAFSLAIAAALTILGDGWPFGDWQFSDLLGSPGAYPAFAALFFAGNGYIVLALLNAIGRRSEKAADLFAVRALDDPSDFRDAILRITVANRSALTVGGPIAGATCTHPPGEQRIRLIDAWIQEHPAAV